MTSKTCTAAELERETAAGWTLREIRDEERQEPGQLYYTQESRRGCSYAVSVTKQGPPVVVRQLVFVLERSRDEELDLVREGLATALEHERMLAAERDAVAKKLTSAEEARDRFANDVEDMRQRRDTEVEVRRKAEALNRRLEADIAKVRREVGEARFREIIGPPPESRGTEGKENGR